MPPKPSPALTGHRCHDYPHLVRRWRALARRAGLTIEPLALADGHPAWFLRSPALRAEGGIYLSAGIHGDEPAATEAAIVWAENHARRLARMPLLIFPCLNPGGLVQNIRLDSGGRDLNREWNRPRSPIVKAVVRLLRGHRFRLALTLHEDYDAQGLYLYEPAAAKPHWGEDLLAAAARVIPIDTRKSVEGRRAIRPGLVLRRVRDKEFPQQPEAIYLHLHHADRTFTFETPSEFALDRRVAAQVALIEKAISMADG